MSRDYPVPYGGQKVQLLNAYAIGAAVSAQTPGRNAGTGISGLAGAKYVGLQAKFAYGAGGTTTKAWVQTSFDNGVTWVDIANFAFTTAALNKVAAVTIFAAATHATPTDGTLADNTVINGLIGDRLRVKVTTTGTYTGTTTLTINAWVKA